MRKINSESKRLNAALGRGLRTLKPWNWLVILVAVPLLLTAVLWVTAPQLGQAQGAVPAQPTGLTATAGDAQAALAWDDPSNSSITGYEYLLHTQAAKLTASDGAAGDEFGWSVSVDGNTAVVGAPGANGGRGGAYVLTLQSGEWSQVAKLTASDRASNDEFGGSVAVDGDTVVVGADGDDDGGLNAGSAYVFTKPANGWVDATETAKLTASDGAGGDRFGVSVGVDGDTVVVGARLDDDNGGSSGSVYVFTKPANGWTTTSSFAAKLTASDGEADDQVGRSVAVDGDTVVVGAWGDDDNGVSSGSVYVFTKPANAWVTATQTAKLTASDGATNDRFGISVAVDDSTVVVGAYLDDAKRVDSGSAYVFKEPNSGWADATQTAKLTASDGAGGDYFGFSAAVDGDTVVVGAAQDDDNGSKSGSAYVFKEPTSGGWASATETVKLTASDGAADDYFGWSVAVDGDTMMAGALWDDDNGADSGSAYVFEVSDWTAVPSSAAGETNATSYTVTGLTNEAEYDFRIRATNGVGTGPTSDTVTVILALPSKPTGLTATSGNTQAALTWDDPSDSGITGYDYLLQREAAKLTASDGAADDEFGWSVAVDGDTAVVGAHGDNGDQGAAYVLTRQLGVWSQVATLTAFDGAASDNFGYSVSMSGDSVVVGAYLDDDNGNGSGSAYVFTKPADGWTSTSIAAKLTANDGAAGDNLGYAVAVDGDTVVVGAWGDNNDNGVDSGSAYVFTKPPTGWTTTSISAKLTANDGADEDQFGISVAVDGATVVVGAFYDDDEKGSAYLFTKPNSGWADATQTAKLTASDGADEDHFGISVAVDGATVVVGAWHDDDEKGSAYLFREPTSGGWNDAIQTAKLTASDRADHDQFGRSVSVEGDTVVVGALYDDDDGEGSGSAYVFKEPNSGWATATETAKLTASDGAAFDFFGISIAVDGDTVVVGAFYDYDNGGSSGSAYVFEVSDWTAVASSAAGETNATSYTVTGLTNDAEYNFRIRATNGVGTGPTSDTVTVILALPSKPTGLAATSGNTQAALTWDDPSDSGITGYDYLLHREAAKLTPIDGAADDQFGWSVAVDGNTAVVSTYRDDNVKGAVYVLSRESGTWSEVAKLTASDGDAGDHFGYSVAMDGDTVLVGATENDGNSSGSGAAYLFIKPDGGWVTAMQTAKLTAYDGATSDSFGHAVAMDGETVVVGAYRDDDNGLGSGSAYVFTKPSDGWADATETAKLTASDGAAGEYFGLPVAVSGDTVVVSARGDINDRGAVYVFTKPSDGWADATGTVKLTAFDGADDDFGISVAVDGDTVAVGAWYDDDNGFNSGSLYVFTKPGNGWTTTTEAAKLTASDGDANDQFGVSVAVDEEKLVVGAYRTDSFKGSAYVFAKPVNGWATATETAKLNASDRAASDNFGLSVAVDGDTVVVGSPYDDDNGAGSGSVYLYEVSDWTAIPGSAAGETNATSYTVTGLANDEEYDFRIRATNAVGAGPASDAVTVTPTS